MSLAFAPRLRRNRWSFAALLTTVVSLVVGGVAFTQADLKAQALAAQIDLARSEARSLEDFVTLEMKSADVLLQTLMRSPTAPLGGCAACLRQAVGDIPLLRSLSLLNAQGRVVESSAGPNVGLVVDTQPFQPLTDTPLDTLRVGPPWSGRDFSSGFPLLPQHSFTALDETAGFVALVREVVNPTHGLRRMLVALNTDHVLNGFQSRVDAATAVVELWRYDGTLLASTLPQQTLGWPAEPPGPGVMTRLAQSEMGDFTQPDADGEPVLVTYRASSIYPLLVVTRHTHKALLQPWAQANRTVWATTLSVLALAVGLATWFYWRQERAALARWRQRQHLRLAASVFTHAQEAITITDLEGHIVSVNAAFSRITGYTPDEVLGRNPNMLSSGIQGPAFYAQLWQTLKAQGHWSGEIWNRRKSGEVYAELLQITAVPDDNGQPQNYVAMFQDITQQKAHQAQLERIAHFDALTQLPNRVLLADRLRQGLAQAQRRGGLMAVVFLDLDHFKEVNDTHGHEVGDQLLVAVAQRLRASLRDGDTLSRVGGDEFVAVLADIADASECRRVLQRLLQAASEPVPAAGLALQVSASLGAALFPQDGTEADTLLRHADQAMYQAKQSGKNRYQLFDAAQDSTTRLLSESRSRLAQALLQNEFVLYHQPKVNLRQGRVVGAEALVRWLHPERGLVAPGQFLPDIEGHALSARLGDWVLATALAQLDAWQVAGFALPLSVNVSAHHLQQPDFVARLAELLKAHPRVSPSALELEVLETSALEDVARVSAVMRECQALGVSFALDDFGTGYSSLTYLKRLPASVLKIDQSFIRDMLDSPDDRAIVQGVVGLAQAFGLGVIAEGVETRAHGDLLLHMGCDTVQGYGVARPMPADALPAWVQHWQSQPGWMG